MYNIYIYMYLIYYFGNPSNLKKKKKMEANCESSQNLKKKNAFQL